MRKKILYLIDETASPEKIKFLKIDSKDTVTLATLSWKEDLLFEFKKILENNCIVNSLALSKEISLNSISLREEFIDFISGIPEEVIFKGKSLKKFLKFPFQKFSSWWFSLISEKNPLKTDSFLQLVRLFTILETINANDYNYLYTDIDNPSLIFALADNVKSFKLRDLKTFKKPYIFNYILVSILRTFKFCLDLFLRKYFFRSAKLTREKINKIAQRSEYILITDFPTLKKQNIESGFIDRFYYPIQNALKKNKRNYCFIFNYATFDNCNTLKECSYFVRNLRGSGFAVFSIEEFITLGKLIQSAFIWSILSLKFMLILPVLSKLFVFRNINVWNLLKKDCAVSFSGHVLFDAIFYFHLFNKIFEPFNPGDKILYLAEMQGWEKAMNCSVARNRKVKSFSTFGIQHVAVGLMNLNYFYSASELKAMDFSENVPKPDFLLCTGPMQIEVFQRNGWPKENLISWGAMRFQGHKGKTLHTPEWSRRDVPVVVVLPGMLKQADELLEFVSRSFDNSSNFLITIKTHDALTLRKLKYYNKLMVNNKNFEVSNDELWCIAMRSKLMITACSSASIISIGAHCPVVVPCLSDSLMLDPMIPHTDACIRVYTPKELLKISVDIINSRHNPLNVSDADRFFEHNYKLLECDEDYLLSLNNLVKTSFTGKVYGYN